MVGEVRFAAARNFSKFDGMRTEELKELLHQDSISSVQSLSLV